MFHFELSFALVVRFASKFIFLFKRVQLFQHNVLKMLSFLHYIGLHLCQKSVGHTRVGIFLCSLFWSTDQCASLLNNQKITEEIKEEIKKYLETNDNENTMTQNLWDAAKAVLRGKFTAKQSYLKKQETFQINNLTLHLKQFEKEEQKTPKVSRRKKIIKVRSEINEKEMKETIAKVNKTKS